jgi:hypothetical protein
MCKEIWKTVEGFGGAYEISSAGNVRRLPTEVVCGNRWGTTTIQKRRGGDLSWVDWPGAGRATMPGVHRCFGGVDKLVLVKRLVYEAFSGVRLETATEVFQKDGDHYNCAISNLDIRPRAGADAIRSNRESFTHRVKAGAVERWKGIKGFGNYEVSSHGNVRSNGKPLRAISNSRRHPYAKVALRSNGKAFTKLVKRLTYEAFVGPIPEGFSIQVNDGDERNCRVDNLSLYLK